MLRNDNAGTDTHDTASNGTTELDLEPQRWDHYFMSKAGRTLRWLAHDNRPVGLFLLSLLFTTLGRYASTLELQYITKRYAWSWSQVSKRELLRLEWLLRLFAILGRPRAIRTVYHESLSLYGCLPPRWETAT